MSLFEQVISSGRVIDWLLGFILVEVLVLGLYWHKTGHGIAPKSLVAMLGAGACLMMAVKTALTQGGAGALAFWITLSLVFHLFDLHRRWNHHV